MMSQSTYITAHSEVQSDRPRRHTASHAASATGSAFLNESDSVRPKAVADERSIGTAINFADEPDHPRPPDVSKITCMRCSTPSA